MREIYLFAIMNRFKVNILDMGEVPNTTGFQRDGDIYYPVENRQIYMRVRIIIYGICYDNKSKQSVRMRVIAASVNRKGCINRPQQEGLQQQALTNRP